ncbi:hypothetical protein HDV02_004343 [Globomyces sp. JEL0801]|nr:hypothetical protein HDV02_004343 [Globomyces sp. JEL0801]
MERKDVNVQQTVWTTMALACSFYILSGVIMGSGFNNIEPNMLVTQLKSKLPLAFPALTKIMVYAFAFVMLIPSIPVNLIVSKDNLVQNQVVSNTVATIISLVLPWIISMPMLLFSGDNMQTFQTWTSLLFVSTSNFIIPIIIFLKCLDFRHRYNADKELSEKQMSLLKRIHFRSESLVQHIETRSQSRLSGITAFAAATATAFSADDGVAEGSTSVCNRDSVVTVNSNTELLGVHQSRFLKKKSSEPAWLSEDVPDPDKEDQLDERMGLRRPTLMNGFRTRSTSDTPSTSNSRENRTDGIRTMGRLPNRNNQAKTLNRPRHGTMDIATRSSTVRFAEPLLPSPTDSETFELQETQPELVDQEFELDTSDLDTVGGGEFNASRLMTLPTHPSFKSPAFRSIPKWVGLRGKSVAIFVLTITSLTTLVNLAINLYNLTT